MEKKYYRLPPITLLAILVEFSVLIFCSVSATSLFLNPNPAVRIPGTEFEWLTSSAEFASVTLRDEGYIPLWQPYLSHGEPLIDNPFSMVLNPISTVPTLLYGSNLGLRYTVVLSTIIAALGGWALGRMLGFGSLARILLGLLMAGKGNIMGMVGSGYFQLAVSQVYIPWVIAGAIGILRMKHRRFPLVLTAATLTLMFWAGNIYYTLPTMISVLGLALTHIPALHRDSNRMIRLSIDRVALRRLIGAGVLTVGLSAATLIPIFAHQQRIGGHPDEAGAGSVVDLGATIHMFFDGSLDPFMNGTAPGQPEFYASYVLPLWFGLLIFIVLPPFSRRLYRSPLPKGWQVWSVALVMIVFFTLWGVGQNPIVGWMYANLPLIGQWRFVGRMLGVASFWIAVLVALRVDGLWRAWVVESAWQSIRALRPFPIVGWIVAGMLIVVGLIAGTDVISRWENFSPRGTSPATREAECVHWLRQTYPTRFLGVWTIGYDTMTIYMQDRIRHANITADFFVIGNDATLLKQVDMTRILPEFGIPWGDPERQYLTENGFAEITNSPQPYGVPCLWHKPDALPYAFTAPLDDLKTDSDESLPFSAVTGIDRMQRLPDRILLAVGTEAGKRTVATVQEVAYPGWTVAVDGQPAKLESVGGILGVILPDDTGQHLIDFAYRPPLLRLGSYVTLLTVLLSTLYLLRLDRFIPHTWKARGSAAVERSAKGLYTVLTSPDVFAPKLPDEEVRLLPPGEDAAREVETVEGEEVETEPQRAR